MRPVGYDVGIPMLLEQTREQLLQAEEATEDDSIEIISGPHRGTKRKTPPAPLECRRPMPSPSTSSTSSPSRPKRSTANTRVNYREYDSDGDLEPVRAATPGPSGSQPRRVVQWYRMY